MIHIIQYSETDAIDIRNHDIPYRMDDIRSALSNEVLPYIDRITDVYNAPFARQLGIEISHISDDLVEIYLDIKPEHINSRGFVHGAVIYGLMDHSLAFASNMKDECVGQNSNIIYHRPAKEGRLICRTILLNSSRSFFIYEAKVFSNDRLIATSTLTAFRLGEKK